MITKSSSDDHQVERARLITQWSLLDHQVERVTHHQEHAGAHEQQQAGGHHRALHHLRDLAATAYRLQRQQREVAA